MTTWGLTKKPPKLSNMTKTTMKKAQNKQTQRTRNQAPRTMERSHKLDANGRAYAALLSDPCNAPLVHPTYSGTEGGYLLRADQFYSTGFGATDTAGLQVFTPGLVDSGGSGVIGFGASSGSTAVAPNFLGASLLPAYTFLVNSASAVRCVAACMKVTFPGAESARAGRIHYGQTSSGIVTTAAIAADNVAQALPNFSRVPADTIELIWKPNDADQLFMRPGSSMLDDNAKNNKSASLVFSWAGIPVSTGMTIHLTAVYEWQPKASQGISVPNLSKSPSQNTLDEVVNFLIAKGETFVRSTAHMAGRAAMAGVLSAAYGLMDPRPRVRGISM